MPLSLLERFLSLLFWFFLSFLLLWIPLPWQKEGKQFGRKGQKAKGIKDDKDREDKKNTFHFSLTFLKTIF